MFEEQAAILPKLFERRQVRLIEQIRYDRKVIAAKMNAEGMLRSGAFVVAVSKAYVAKYEEFAHGLINETLDLFRRSGIAFDRQSAEWIRAKVGHYLEVGDRNVRGEAEGGKILQNEIKENVGHAMDQALNRMRRDLEIELDLALVDLPTAAETVRRLGRRAFAGGCIGPASWLLFHDAYLSGEWVGLADDSPPPEGMA